MVFWQTILAGGRRIEGIELRRNDEVLLNSLAAEHIPDPTTAGDFCRRLSRADIDVLQDCINRTRLKVRRSPRIFSPGFSPVSCAAIVFSRQGRLLRTIGKASKGELPLGEIHPERTMFHPGQIAVECRGPDDLLNAYFDVWVQASLFVRVQTKSSNTEAAS